MWVEFYKAWTFRTCFFIYCLFIFYLKDYQKAQASLAYDSFMPLPYLVD
jgi:hypothetical protein